MWTIATLTIPARELPLAQMLKQVPDCDCRVKQVAFGNDDRSLFVLFRGVTADTLEGALSDDPSVAGFSLVRTEGEALLYNLDLAESMILPIQIFKRTHATVETAHGDATRWTFEVRCSDRSSLSVISDEFDRRGIEMTYRSITDKIGGPESDLLTEKQLHVLRTAIDAGYYEIPRAITLEEFADELGISHQALSEQLRRAQGAIVESNMNGP